MVGGGDDVTNKQRAASQMRNCDLLVLLLKPELRSSHVVTQTDRAYRDFIIEQSTRVHIYDKTSIQGRLRLL